MKRVERDPPPRRDRHPALETFERVLYNGVIVDYGETGPYDRRRRFETTGNLFSTDATTSTNPLAPSSFWARRWND